ncbi:hypothetical protein KEM55_004760 [Ascosphaera atra]|nr:hypothetical protein KEM55_004760 [Ascosphaera atra]
MAELDRRLQKGERRLRSLRATGDPYGDGCMPPDANDLKALAALKLPELKCGCVSEVRSRISRVEAILDFYNVLDRHPDCTAIGWAAGCLRGTAQTEWNLAKSSNTRPHTWPQFLEWLMDTAESPVHRRLRSARRWMEAKQKDKQSCREFFAYMEELGQGLCRPLFEDQEINFMVGKILPYIQQEYKKLPTPPVTR